MKNGISTVVVVLHYSIAAENFTRTVASQSITKYIKDLHPSTWLIDVKVYYTSFVITALTIL